MRPVRPFRIILLIGAGSRSRTAGRDRTSDIGSYLRRTILRLRPPFCRSDWGWALVAPTVTHEARQAVVLVSRPCLTALCKLGERSPAGQAAIRSEMNLLIEAVVISLRLPTRMASRSPALINS